MAMIKTDTARQALRNRASLSVQERQILILCDGIRTRQEIAGWLGDSTLALIDSLAARGYLEHRPTAGPQWARAENRDALRSAAPAPPDMALAAGAAPEVAVWSDATLMPMGREALSDPGMQRADSTAATVAAKRSLAACKMYAARILQMQRGGDAQRLLAQLNASHDETDLLKNLLDLLQFLQLKTSASYTDNVKKHMTHILPEQHLRTLNARWMSYS